MSSNDRVPVETADVWPEDAQDEEALVINWFVNEGSEIEQGDLLCEIQIEKVEIEIPAPASGSIAEIVSGEDAEIERGDTLAYISSTSVTIEP